MKKFILFSAIAVTICCVMHYPLLAAAKTGAGLKTGMAFAKFAGDDVTDAKFRNGFSGGGFFYIDLCRSFRIQNEVLYVTKGNKITGGLTSKHDYITFPLLIKYLLPLNGKVRPNIFLGAEPSFNHSAKLSNGVEIDIDSDIADFDFGIVFGGECAFKTNSGAVTVDIRYTRGLRRLDSAGAGLDFKQSVISIMAGYAFSLGD